MYTNSHSSQTEREGIQRSLVPTPHPRSFTDLEFHYKSTCRSICGLIVCVSLPVVSCGVKAMGRKF